jgi:L-2-hydroxyglutarate oxidase LhgO
MGRWPEASRRRASSVDPPRSYLIDWLTGHLSLSYSLSLSFKSPGAHTTPDLYGGMRLGPMETWLPDERDPAKDFNNPANRSYIGSHSVDMAVSPALKETFVEFLRPFLPFLTPDHIAPDSSGIHPKLQSEHEEVMRDWVVRHEADRRLPNFFNLVGIESPGLTASAALGEYVADMVAGQAK